MTEDIDFETYLNVSQNKFEIYLFDNKKLSSLYKEVYKFESISSNIDLNSLNNFLEDNIFKIEKQIGKFVKNIFLIIEDNRIFNLNIGIKKKNYQQTINKNFLENTLTEAKDLFKETYQDYKIMHMVVKKFLINGNYYSSFADDLKSDNLCLEIKFISIPNNLALEIEKVLEKYQIKIDRYLNESYVIDLNSEKKFEKFFQLFS